jgi:hypothetical protein
LHRERAAKKVLHSAMLHNTRGGARHAPGAPVLPISGMVSIAPYNRTVMRGHRPGTPPGGLFVNRGLRDLLTYIVDRYANTDNARRIDLDANAEQDGDVIEADKAAAADREHDRAGDQADAFGAGLERAWQRARHGGAATSFDDRDPAQNAMAGALIDYLVRFDLAESESRDVGDNHYVYDIAVDWGRLREVAAANGQRLDDLLATPDD